MSYAEKIGSWMQRPNDDLASKDDSPWWLKYSARALGSIGGFLSVFFAVFNVIMATLTFNPMGIFAGISVGLFAFTVLIAEAPCCCMFVDYVQEVNNWIEKRPYWHRAVYYTIVSFVVVVMNFGFNVLFSCGLIFITGLFYGGMAMGRKAPLHEMRNNASVYATNNQQFPPAASNSNLVEGVQPVSFSNPFDSRV